MAYGWLKTRKKASLGRLLGHPRREHGEIDKREFKFKIDGIFEALLRRPLNLRAPIHASEGWNPNLLKAK
jgi:hypothetical protein